jgi:hypothetical protein
LTNEVERNQRHTNELGIRTHILGHGKSGWKGFHTSSGSFINVLLEPLWRVSHTSEWEVFNNEVTILKVRFRMLWGEVEIKFLYLPGQDLSLAGLYSIMSLFIL